MKKESMFGTMKPTDVNDLRDHYIGNHIVSKGYKWIKTKEPC